MKTNTNLATILDALRKEVLAQSNFQVQPTTMSISGVIMNEYEPVKAIVKVNFAPCYIRVSE